MVEETPDNPRQVATSPDQPRLTATDRDMSRLTATDHGQPRLTATTPDMSQYTMTVEEALVRFEAAGIPRNKRTIERYCEHSRIDAVKVAAAFGLTWFLNAESVEGTINRLLKFEEEKKLRQGTTTPDNEARQPTTDHGLSRLTATDRDTSGGDEGSGAPLSQVVAPPEEVKAIQEENDRLKQENVSLKQENVDMKINNRGLTQTAAA